MSVLALGVGGVAATTILVLRGQGYRGVWLSRCSLVAFLAISAHLLLTASSPLTYAITVAALVLYLWGFALDWKESR